MTSCRYATKRSDVLSLHDLATCMLVQQVGKIMIFREKKIENVATYTFLVYLDLCTPRNYGSPTVQLAFAAHSS